MKKVYQEFIYVPKHSKIPDKVFDVRIALSMLIIVFCMTFMLSSAFAFFSDDVEAEVSTLKGAYYTVNVDLADSDGNYVTPLALEDVHTFIISAEGTASTGYCEVEINGTSYYTHQITPGEELRLTVIAAADTKIKFIPQWGTCAYEETYGERVAAVYSLRGGSSDGGIIEHSTTPHAVYVFDGFAELEEVCEYYGVSEDDVLIYNGYGDADEVEVGAELKIPGVDEDIEPYEVSFAVYTVEELATIEDIALHYGVDADVILSFNSIEVLTEGEEIMIPGVDEDFEPYIAPVPVEEETEEVEEVEEVEEFEADDTETTVEEAVSDLISVVEDFFEAISNGEESAEDVPSEDEQIEEEPVEEEIISYEYDMVVACEGMEIEEYLSDGDQFEFILDEGEHEFVLTAAPDMAEGYVRIILAGQREFFTAPVTPENEIRFIINTPDNAMITFEIYGVEMDFTPVDEACFDDYLDYSMFIVEVEESKPEDEEVPDEGEYIPNEEETSDGEDSADNEENSSDIGETPADETENPNVEEDSDGEENVSDSEDIPVIEDASSEEDLSESENEVSESEDAEPFEIEETPSVENESEPETEESVNEAETEQSEIESSIEETDITVEVSESEDEISE